MFLHRVLQNGSESECSESKGCSQTGQWTSDTIECFPDSSLFAAVFIFHGLSLIIHFNPIFHCRSRQQAI